MTHPQTEIDRRTFLKNLSHTGAGLVVGMVLPTTRIFSQSSSVDLTPSKKDFNPNAWIRITPQNEIIFTLDKVEMGQGVMTALPTILAEELEVEADKIKVEFAPADPKYNTPGFDLQITGGSSSVRTSFLPLRTAGAQAREMLAQTAARRWGVSRSQIKAQKGFMVDPQSARRASYGELAEDAMKETLPQSVVLKNTKDFSNIGKPRPRIDAKAKVRGEAVYGIDVSLDGMKYAYILRAPQIGAVLQNFDDAEAKKQKGIIGVCAVSGGVAIVADRFWRARSAAQLIKAQWSAGILNQKSTEDVFNDFKNHLSNAGKIFASVAEPSPSTNVATPKKIQKIEALYEINYMPHATMEPQNATAVVTADRCEIWAPTQGPGIARFVAAEICSLPLEKVFIHQTFLGGGFGRRLAQDYVSDVVQIAKNFPGIPIQLKFSREDDFRTDIYRPAGIHKLSAQISEDGQIQAWQHKVVGPSILAQVVPEWTRSMMPEWIPGFAKDFAGWGAGKSISWSGKDETSVEGAYDHAYATKERHVEYVVHDPGVPVGFWRSVGHSFTSFVVENFIDRCAHLAKIDPLEYRLGLLEGPTAERRRRVLETVATKAKWNERKKNKRFLGIAQTFSFESYAAHIAEVVLVGGKIVLKTVYCAVDCGLVINPDLVKTQVEGAIIFGLSACMYDRITIQNGQVMEDNFDSHRIARMSEIPSIDVTIVPSELSPTGIGEPALPPLAAAIANAIFAATGKQIDRLPFGQA